MKTVHLVGLEVVSSIIMKNRSTPNQRASSPPKRLISTWIWMLSQKDEPALQKQGRNNLIAAFGSLEEANRYVKDMA